MSTMPWRAPARLFAAPLVLTLLVAGQAQASPRVDTQRVETQPVVSSVVEMPDHRKVLREVARQARLARQAEAERRERAAAAIGQRIVAAAAAQAGKPYVYGATGPSSFDCSGLTGWAYAAAGIDLPRTSAAQAAVMTRVSEPLPGDLVYFPGHIGIYAGNHQMWHAPHSGDVVKLSTIWVSSPSYGRVR